MATSSPTLRADAFDAPTPLYLPLPGDPDEPGDAVSGEVRKGVVELSIKIDEHGFVSRIDTLRSEPEDLMDYRVRRAVKKARYRPAFNGEATLAADDVRIEHTFVYYSSSSSDEAPSRSSSAAPGEPQRPRANS